jgi:hypothetical protein
MRPHHSSFWLTCSACVLSSLCLASPVLAQDEAPEEQASEEQPADVPLSISALAQLGFRGSVSGQWFWMRDKAMPGMELAVGHGLLEGNLELSFLTLTRHSNDLGGSLLGNQLGLYAMLTPLRERHYEVSVGLGADFYLLWAIHSGARESALAPRVVARVWPLENVAISFSARTYLLHSDGLDLGTARDGSSGSSILLSTGITWGFR